MATWTSRGLRGSALEDYINHTNEQYRNKGLALIQKIPTPITPVRIDKEHRHITLAYFDREVPSIISAPCRGFRSASMPKSARRTPSRFRMYTGIR